MNSSELFKNPDVTSKDFYNALKFMRKEYLAEEFDGILYPHVNNDSEDPVYLYLDKKTMEEGPFKLDNFFPNRAREEVLPLFKAPFEVKFKFYQDYVVPLDLNFNSRNFSYELRIAILPESMYSIIHHEKKNPPLLLCKGKTILYACKNIFLDEGINSTDYLIYGNHVTQMLDIIIEKNFIKVSLKNSVKTKMDAVDLNLETNLLKQSPLIKNGLSLNFLNDQQERVVISVWIKNNKIFVRSGIVGRLPILLKLDLSNISGNIDEEMIQRIFWEQASISPEEIVNDSFWFESEDKVKFCEQLHRLTVTSMLTFREFSKIDESNATFEAITHKVYKNFIDGLKYVFCLNMPELRTYVKGGANNNIDFSEQNQKKFISKTWNWGTNKIRYVYPKKSSKNKKVAHYVRPHIAKTRIIHTSKYKNYIIQEDFMGKYIMKWRNGCWKGMQDIMFSLGTDSYSGYSKKAIAWLKRTEKEKGISIQHAENGGEIRLELGDGKYYLLDGFCKETNTVYEFHGNIFHGNPRIFKADEKCHPFSKKTAEELYSATLKREKNILKMGFNLEVIWEDEFDKLVRRN